MPIIITRAGDLKFFAVILSLTLALVSCSAPPVQNSQTVSTDPLVLTDLQGKYPLGLHMEILEDPSGELGIEQVASLEFDSRFVPSQVEVPNFGFTENVYWARLKVWNESELTENWILETGFQNLQYVDLFVPGEDSEGFSVKQAGTMRPVTRKDYAHPSNFFNLSLPEKSQQTYYLRFKTGSSMTLGLNLWSPRMLFTYIQSEQLLYGIIFGILIGLLVYNLFIFISLRDTSYIPYIFFIGCMIIQISSYTGYLILYIIPNLYFLSLYLVAYTYGFVNIALILFTDVFLTERVNLPKYHRVNQVLLVVWVLTFLIYPFVSYFFIAMMLVTWSFVTVIMVSVSWLVSWRGGFQPARFLVFAWFFLFGTLQLVLLVRFGLVPSTTLSENAFLIGYALVPVCMSFALAERINLLESEKEQANLELAVSEARYRRLVETMNDGLGIIDESGRFTYANQRFSEMIEYPLEEVIGEPVAKFLNDDNKKILADQLKLRKTGIGEPYELTWQKKEGSEIFTLVSPVAVFDNGKTYKGSFAVITDITEKVVAGRMLEKRVEERTHELSALLDITHAVISPSSIESTLNQILERLQTILDIHRLVIIGEQQDGWRVLAQICPCFPPDCESIQFAVNEMQDLINDFSSSEPVLIKCHEGAGGDCSGFRAIVSGLSAGCSAELRCWLGAPLLEKDRIVGVLLFGCEQEELSAGQYNIIQAAANLVSMAIENNRLYNQLRESVLEEERNRLARDLHDSVTQTLFTASVLAEATPRIWEKDEGIARQNLEKLSRMIRGALAEMRSMLIELRIGEVAQQNLDQLLHTLFEAVQGRSKILINESIADIPEIPKNVKSVYYRVAREALNNVVVHAAATRVDVLLVEKQGGITLEIKDNGKGFNPQEPGAGHLGLKIMEERAAAIGADLQILSEPAKGTRVILSWLENAGIQAENE